MGGSGGGYSSSIDLGKLTAAANERIHGALSERRLTIFACHSQDRANLEARIGRTSAIKSGPFEVYSEEIGKRVPLEKAGLIVVYVEDSDEHDFLNFVIARSFELKRNVVFVKAEEDSPVPNRVIQFRVRTLSWSQLQEILVA